MLDVERFQANKYMTGEFAKFNNWNESIYLELCDELSRDELVLLQKKCSACPSAKHYFYQLIHNDYDGIHSLIQTYKGYGTIKKADRNPAQIYGAIILIQYTRALYCYVFSTIHQLSDFADFNTPQEGNALLTESAFDLLLQGPNDINYWPFPSVVNE